jgi:ankyrin repeat protein
MPLLLAAQNGDVATVERLLKAGAKVDGVSIADEYEIPILTSPLLTAAVAGQAAVIAVILKATPGALYHANTPPERAGFAEGLNFSVNCADTKL